MSGQLGCVLAIRDRPPAVLERTLQTYVYQTHAPRDKVLLDYGSAPEAATEYGALCQRYGWRLVSHVPARPRWSLSDAYNRAVSQLDDAVDVVFKSDVDVLLGQDVLAFAAALGQKKLCLFSCLTTQQGTTYPPCFNGQADLIGLLDAPVLPTEMAGEGIHACPRKWFTEIGGYDLEFEDWGFEDSDLRERAKWSIGITSVAAALLIHQAHPRTSRPRDVAKNKAYYERMKRGRQVVRNGVQVTTTMASGGRQPPVATSQQGADAPRSPAESVAPLRLAVVTRSMNEQLFQASDELLGLDRLASRFPLRYERHRLTEMASVPYFQQLLRFDVDWVVNLDEDAFVLAPEGLVELIRTMEQQGYAACGMPDGGVVPMRQHNPVACNAFFNVFDLRRVRPVWRDWEQVLAATHQRDYESRTAEFARRTPYAYDHFEGYYGVFFSLLAAGERILYLDAEEWEDGVSTLVKGATGQPLLIHCWYTRNWPTSYHTRRRYQAAIDHARQVQGLSAVPSAQSVARPASITAIESNLGKWDPLYRDKNRQPYGDPLTYQMAAHFLKTLTTVEDWGCGWAWFKRYLPGNVTYRGIDGSHSPFADVIADLTTYTSETEGILLRHVLEHNPAWQDILANAIRSFTRRMVLVVFTPFAEKTHVISYNEALRLPDIAFAKNDLIRHFAGLRWKMEERLRTKTQYGVESVFYLEKG